MTEEETIEKLWEILEFENDRKYISKFHAEALRIAISCVKLVSQFRDDTKKIIWRDNNVS